MLLESLEVLEGFFEVLLGRRDDRTGPQWAALFLGVLLLLGAVGPAVSSGMWYGLAVAVVGIALCLYGRRSPDWSCPRCGAPRTSCSR